MKKNKIKKFKNGDTVKVYIYIDDVNTASLKVIGIINAHNFSDHKIYLSKFKITEIGKTRIYENIVEFYSRFSKIFVRNEQILAILSTKIILCEKYNSKIKTGYV
jgi:hypothetical protein